MQNIIYTLAEVAALLKVHEDTVIAAIKNSQLSATKIGRQWRISEDQLSEYINNRTLRARKKFKPAI